MSNCIFCQVISRKKAATVVYEDAEIFAFNDINPQAPTHILIVPREHIATIEDASPDILGKLLAKATDLAKSGGLSAKGYRIVINFGDHAGQSVYHLHVHLLGGRWFSWPPG